MTTTALTAAALALGATVTAATDVDRRHALRDLDVRRLPCPHCGAAGALTEHHLRDTGDLELERAVASGYYPVLVAKRLGGHQ